MIILAPRSVLLLTPVSSLAWRPADLVSGQEIADQSRDLGPVGLEGEMTGIQQVNFGIRVVALVRFGPRRDENLVVFAPDDEGRRPMLAEI